MRGLRITPNGLTSIDILTDEVSLNISVGDNGCIQIRDFISKNRELKAEVWGWNSVKPKRVREFEVIYITPKPIKEVEGE